MTLLDKVHQLGPGQWFRLAYMALAVVSLTRLSWLRRAYRRRLRTAVDWPKTEGRVWSAEVVKTRDSEANSQDCDAVFTYSFSLNINGQLEYFSGECGRPFKNVDAAAEWLKSLEGEAIPVRFQPGKPDVSAVLIEDIDGVEVQG